MIQEIRRFHRFERAHPVASRKPLAAWKRWLRWQIGSRCVNAPVVMPWLEGSFLVVERGMVGATGNLYCGLHEFNDMALVLHYFGGGPGLFLDIGANIGSYTVLAAKVANAHAISVEPVPQTFARLMRNLTTNTIQDRVDARQVAVGAAAGTLRFSSDRDATNQVVDDTYQGDSLTVAVMCVDDLLEGRKAQVWKVDVEGFEKEVLAGAARSLADPGLQVVLLECEDEAIKKTLQVHGFTELSYDPFQRVFRGHETQAHSGNHVWIRDREEVQARCRKAARLTVCGVEF